MHVYAHLSCHGRSHEVIQPRAKFSCVRGSTAERTRSIDAAKSGSMWAPAIAKAIDKNIRLLKENLKS